MIPLRILGEDDVRAVLDIKSAIEYVEKAYMLKASKKGRLFPLISEEFLPGKADMDIKSGLLNGENIFGLKLVSWFGDNYKLGIPALSSLSMVFDLQNGLPKAIISSRYLTGMRTGAAGAIGVKYLAKKSSKVLFVAGTGAQSVYQIAASLSAMPTIQKVYLFNPLRYDSACKLEHSIKEQLIEIQNDNENTDNRKWARRVQQVEFTAVDRAEESLAETDVVITVTPSHTPFIMQKWIKPGTHFSCIGADMPSKQEIDEKLFNGAVVFADDIEQASKAGEIQNAIKSGLLNKSHLTEIGELITGNSKGRLTDRDITVFDSTGIALQDLAVSKYLISIAEERNLGTVVQI